MKNGKAVWRGLAAAVFAMGMLLPWGVLRAEEPAVPELTEAWDFNRIRKDARQQRSHFYVGKLGLRNPSGEPMTNVSAQISIYDPGGNVIDSSKRLPFGTLRPGASAVRDFDIDRGVQFAEIQVHVQYTLGGQTRTAQFSSIDGTRPQSITVEADARGVALLACDINRPVRGSGPTKVTARVRNIGGIEATNVRLTVVLKNDQGESQRRASDRVTKQGPYEIRLTEATKEETTYVITFNTALAPGETKSFVDIELPNSPRHAGFSSSLAADYPEEEQVEGPEGIVLDTGQGDVEINKLAIADPGSEEGSILTFEVVNKSPDLPAKALTLYLTFFDGDENEINTVEYNVPVALPTGKAVPVTSGRVKVPAYVFYEVGASFEIAPEPEKVIQFEIREGETVPEGVEVIEVFEVDEGE